MKPAEDPFTNAYGVGPRRRGDSSRADVRCVDCQTGSSRTDASRTDASRATFRELEVAPTMTSELPIRIADLKGAA